MQRSRLAPLFDEVCSWLVLASFSLWLYTCQIWEVGRLASTNHTHIRLLLPDMQSQPLRVSQLSTKSCLSFHLVDPGKRLCVWCFQSKEVQFYKHWCCRNKRYLTLGLLCVPCSRHKNSSLRSTDHTLSGTRVMSSSLARLLTHGLQRSPCFPQIQFASLIC